MQPDSLPIGALVVHATKTDWGLGKIVRVEGDLVDVFWPEREGSEALLMHKRGVKLAPNQHDPFLDNLPTLIVLLGGRRRLRLEFRHRSATGLPDCGA